MALQGFTGSNQYLFYSNMTWKKSYHIKIEAVVRRCSVKKMFLEISQNALENTCAGDCF